MAVTATLDFETRSRTDLRRSGVHRYAEDQTTAPWCFSYRLDRGPVGRWRPGEPLPRDLVEHIALGRWVVSHGAMFERTIWNNIIIPVYAPMAPRIEAWQQSCTMARAYAMALPPDLERLAEVLNVPHQKDAEGHKLMMKMARPRRVAGEAVYWVDDEPNQQRLGLYCDGDVYAEDDVGEVVPWLTPDEQELWVLDQEINDRGVRVDIPLVVRATELVAYAQRRANHEMARLTNGAATATTQVQSIVDWLNARGIPCERMRKGDQEDLITIAEVYDDPTAVAVVELRRTSAKTSTAKYEKILEVVCFDDCIRGQLQYHGARTGRWAGRLVQLQNFPRVDADTETEPVALLVYLLHSSLPISEVFELMELVGAPRTAVGDEQKGMATLAWLSKALRSTIIAHDGRKLVGGDFSNIEGRVTGWLSGEAWKLEAFVAYDTITGYKDGKPVRAGVDLYVLSYANSFGVPIEAVTKALRQIGKVQELALGFQGGVGAFYTMTLTYMVKLYKIVDAVRLAVTKDEWDAMADKFDGARDSTVHHKQFGTKAFTRSEWTALKIVVGKWRLAHPNTTQGWWDLQDASIEAVSKPGTIVPIYGNKARYMCDGHFLYCQLPSGRVISYASPWVDTTRTEQIYNGARFVDVEALEPAELEQLLGMGYQIKTQTRNQVKFWGINDNKQWSPRALYGGFQCENIVQAVARDVMRSSMKRAKAAGYPLILTVHDELLTEPEETFGSAAHLQELMSVKEPWMGDLPVSAAAWEDVRYVK